MIQYHDPARFYHKEGENAVVFEASHQDNTDATYHYYGYISANGTWIVQRFHFQGSTIIYLYFGGQTIATYNALWNAAGVYIGSLTFVRYDKI